MQRDGESETMAFEIQNLVASKLLLSKLITLNSKALVTMMYIWALYIYKYILEYTSILDNDQCLIYY